MMRSSKESTPLTSESSTVQAEALKTQRSTEAGKAITTVDKMKSWGHNSTASTTSKETLSP